MNVYQALQSSRFLPRLMGAAPFGLSSTSIKFSRLGQIWPLLNLPIIASLLYLYRSRIPHEIHEIKQFLITTNTWIQYFLASYSILMDGFRQQSIVKVVQSMDEYDKKSGYNSDALGREESLRVRFWSFAYSVLLILLAIARMLAWNILDLDPASEIFIMQIDNSISMFAVFTTLLGMRFRHLNSMVEQDRCIKVQRPGSENVANPEYVRLLYTSLLGIGNELNDHYAGRLFLWATLKTLALITRFYYMLTEKVTPIFVVATIIRTVPSVLGLLCFCISCQFTVDEANRTPAVLLETNIRHTALIDRGRKVLKIYYMETFTLSLYMGLRAFEFSALGFFNVDITLFFGVITVALSYLILCLQTGGS